jgi:hypothetical protein
MSFETEPSNPTQENCLSPVSELINRRLFQLRGLAENNLQSINNPSDQRVLLDTLDCISPNATPDLIHYTLTPFVEASLDPNTRETLKTFNMDLAFLHVFYERGLPGLNEVLNTWVQGAKEGNEEDVTTANQLLLRAIYLFPHVAHGVNITIDPELYERYSEFRGLAEYYQFKHLPSPSTITLPLPYVFSTGTIGSGERNALNNSITTVELLSGSETGNGKPALNMEIESPGGFARNYMNIPLEMAHTIEFTSTDRFIPYVELGPHTKTTERDNHLTHYIYFRNFAPNATTPEDMKNRITEDELLAVQSLLIPIQQPALWRDRSRVIIGTYLQKGFMVLLNHKAKETQLLEFTNTNYPSLSDNDFTSTAVRLFVKAMRGEIKQDHLAVMTGNQIIERLMTIPPQRFGMKYTT